MRTDIQIAPSRVIVAFTLVVTVSVYASVWADFWEADLAIAQ